MLCPLNLKKYIFRKEKGPKKRRKVDSRNRLGDVQKLNLTTKDFKTAIINMLENLKENISRMNKKMGYLIYKLQKSQMEILELISIISEMKDSLDALKSDQR